MNEIVTYFALKNSKLANDIKLMKLSDVLSDFRNGKYADRIAGVRAVMEREGEAAYKEAKNQLPAIAFCGAFAGGHAKSDLVEYNSLLVFDIDHLTVEEMQVARVKLSHDSLILALWTSPSGGGYKGLIRLVFENVPEGATLDACYKQAFAEATLYFRELFQVELDRSCSDYSRICYVCWDDELYVNEGARVMAVDCSRVRTGAKTTLRQARGTVKGATIITDFKPANVAGKNRQHDRNLMSSIIAYMTKRGLSITYSYDEWLRVGFGIASTFNYDLGLKYYIALSRMDGGKYDEVECTEKLKECYMKGTGEVTLGTIVEMARNKGYKLKGSSGDL